MQIKIIMLLGACITASYSGAMEEPNNSETQVVENSRKAAPRQVINVLCAGYHCFTESDIPYLAALPREVMERVVGAIRQEINKDTVSLLDAVKVGNKEEVGHLLENCCVDVNITDMNSTGNYFLPTHTLLMLAISCGYKEIAEMLINAGADLNMQDNRGDTALKHAVMYTSKIRATEIAEMLINAGANVNIQDNYGTTALMYAVIYDRAEIVQMLLDAGADINVQNYRGCTALGYLQNNQKNNQEIANLIRAAEEKAQSTLDK